MRRLRSDLNLPSKKPSLPHGSGGFFICIQLNHTPQPPVGAGLPEIAVCLSHQFEAAAAIAGKPAPTLDLYRFQVKCSAITPAMCNIARRV